MTEARFPALSVRQPYANAILYGAKDIENKITRTHFRGTILLHASASLADKDVPRQARGRQHTYRLARTVDRDEYQSGEAT
jgi:hypothetical protein